MERTDSSEPKMPGRASVWFPAAPLNNRCSKTILCYGVSDVSIVRRRLDDALCPVIVTTVPGTWINRRLAAVTRRRSGSRETVACFVATT